MKILRALGYGLIGVVVALVITLGAFAVAGQSSAMDESSAPVLSFPPAPAASVTPAPDKNKDDDGKTSPSQTPSPNGGGGSGSGSDDSSTSDSSGDGSGSDHGADDD